MQLASLWEVADLKHSAINLADSTAVALVHGWPLVAPAGSSLELDALINIHELTTGGVKNWFGIAVSPDPFPSHFLR